MNDYQNSFDPDRFSVVTFLGQGAHGVVCSAVDKLLGLSVAVKKVSDAFRSEKALSRVLREILITKHLSTHPNLIRLIDVHRSPDKKHLYLVFELFATDLRKVILSGQPLSLDHVRWIIFQVLRGLSYMHSAGIIHRDIKPENLLLTEECDVKICDHGLSRPHSFGESLTEYVATRWYRAPEIMLNSSGYDCKADVWAVGCIMAELFLGHPLFPGDNYKDQLKKIFAVVGSPNPDDFDQITQNPRARSFLLEQAPVPRVDFHKIFPSAQAPAVDLLSRLLEFNPVRRVSAHEALLHPFFSSVFDNDTLQTCDPFLYYDRIVSCCEFLLQSPPESTAAAAMVVDAAQLQHLQQQQQLQLQLQQAMFLQAIQEQPLAQLQNYTALLLFPPQLAPAYFATGSGNSSGNKNNNNNNNNNNLHRGLHHHPSSASSSSPFHLQQQQYLRDQFFLEQHVFFRQNPQLSFLAQLLVLVERCGCLPQQQQQQQQQQQVPGGGGGGRVAGMSAYHDVLPPSPSPLGLLRAQPQPQPQPSHLRGFP